MSCKNTLPADMSTAKPHGISESRGPRKVPEAAKDRLLGESAQHQPPEIHCLDVRPETHSGGDVRRAQL